MNGPPCTVIHSSKNFSVDSTTAQSVVKQHKLVSNLSKDKERLSLEMQKKVFPILDGKDHNRLLYYFLIMERGCEGMQVAKDAQTHRSVLRHVMKLLPGKEVVHLHYAYPELEGVL